MRLNRRSALSLFGAAAGASLASSASADQPVQEGEIRLSRDYTVTGSPVTVQGPEGVEWELRSAPGGSDASFHDPTARTTSIRPDEPGEYVVAARTDDGTTHAGFHADPRNALIDRHAPVFGFHLDDFYRPTRYEAMLSAGELRRTDSPAPSAPGSAYTAHRAETDPHDGAVVAADPTLFDLAGKDGSHYIYLPGPVDEYRTYHERYPPTIYANVTETTFRGESYTAVVYWHFYVFDPKRGGAEILEHQADLESCIVLVGADGPEWFGAVQHGSGEFRRWEATPTRGSHPEVFVEMGAHATMLRDTSRYDGDGFLVQGYHVGGQFPTSEGTETDPALTAAQAASPTSGEKIDETGSAEVWHPEGRGDVEYQLVPLVGNEVWSTYEGGFSDSPGGNTGPFQRSHYRDPGSKIADRLYAGHEQIDATADVRNATVAGDALTVHLGVRNWGPKPHPFWASVEVKPPDADWADGTVRSDQRFRVGTDFEAFVDRQARGERVGETAEKQTEVTVPLPEGYDENWGVRVRVWNYPAAVRRAHDLQDERAVEPTPVPQPEGSSRYDESPATD